MRVWPGVRCAGEQLGGWHRSSWFVMVEDIRNRELGVERAEKQIDSCKLYNYGSADNISRGLEVFIMPNFKPLHFFFLFSYSFW